MTYLEVYEIVKVRFSHNEKDLKRFHHQEEVVKMALLLNEKYNLGLDVEKVKLAGILHDYSKIYTDQEMIERLVPFIGKEAYDYQNYLPVVHSILGAYLVRSELGIMDSDIFNAIYYHTTGCPKMEKLAMLIYVADAVEATRSYPGADYYRSIVMQNFEKGFFAILKGTIDSLKKRGMPVQKMTIETYNYYKEYFNEV